MAESLYGLKTRWEKENLLIQGNFSFSHNVFKRFALQTHKNQGLFGKGSDQHDYVQEVILYLILYEMTKFWYGPNRKHLQPTNQTLGFS